MNIVIIGGSRGIGKAAARELLQEIGRAHV